MKTRIYHNPIYIKPFTRYFREIQRIDRGGSFLLVREDSTPDDRDWSRSTSTHRSMGFRIVRNKK